MKNILSNRGIRDILSQSNLDPYTDRLVKNKAALDVISKSLEENINEKNFSEYKRLIKAVEDETDEERKKRAKKEAAAARRKEKKEQKERQVSIQEKLERERLEEEKRFEEEELLREKIKTLEEEIQDAKDEGVDVEILEEQIDMLDEYKQRLSGKKEKEEEREKRKIELESEREREKEQREATSKETRKIIEREKKARKKAAAKRKKAEKREKEKANIWKEWNEVKEKLETLSEREDNASSIKDYEGIVGNLSYKGGIEDASESFLMALIKLIGGSDVISSQLGAMVDEKDKEDRVDFRYAIIEQFKRKKKGEPKQAIKETVNVEALEKEIRKILSKKIEWKSLFREKQLEELKKKLNSFRKKRKEIEKQLKEIQNSEYKEEISVITEEDFEENKEQMTKEITNKLLEVSQSIEEVEEIIISKEQQKDKKIKMAIMTKSTENIGVLPLIHEHLFGHLPKFYLKRKRTEQFFPETETSFFNPETKKLEPFVREATTRKVKTLETELNRLKREVRKDVKRLYEEKFETEGSRKLEFEVKAISSPEFGNMDSEKIQNEIAKLLDMKKQLQEEIENSVLKHDEALKHRGETSKEDLKEVNEEIEDIQLDIQDYKKQVDEWAKIEQVKPENIKFNKIKGKLREGSLKEKEIAGKIEMLEEKIKEMDAIAELADVAMLSSSDGGKTEQEIERNRISLQQKIGRAKSEASKIKHQKEYEFWTGEFEKLKERQEDFKGEHGMSPEKYLKNYHQLLNQHKQESSKEIVFFLDDLQIEAKKKLEMLLLNRRTLEDNLEYADGRKRKVEVKEFKEKLENKNKKAERGLDMKIKRYQEIQEVLEEYENSEADIKEINKKLRGMALDEKETALQLMPEYDIKKTNKETKEFSTINETISRMLEKEVANSNDAVENLEYLKFFKNVDVNQAITTMDDYAENIVDPSTLRRLQKMISKAKKYLENRNELIEEMIEAIRESERKD